MNGQADGRCAQVPQLPSRSVHDLRHHETKLPDNHAVDLASDLMRHGHGMLCRGVGQAEPVNVEAEIIR